MWIEISMDVLQREFVDKEDCAYPCNALVCRVNR